MAIHKYPVLLCALLSTACSDDGSLNSADNIPPDNVVQAVAQLDDIAAEIFKRSGIPGMAISVVHQGQVVYAKGFGVRRLGEPTSIDADTVFQLASVSKSVAATVVAAQVGRGLISWDTPVVQQLPWFALQDPASTAQVTVGDLFAHRSGLPDHAGDDLEDLGYDRRQVLERLRWLPTKPLRSHYAYTNFGLTAGAQAVAAASGAEWEALSDRVIYQPLGMQSTSSRYADLIARDNRAYPHILVDDKFVVGPQRQPDAQSPAGGVSSSVRDMASWMSLVLHEGKHRGQPLIARDALLPAVTPQIQSSPATPESPAGFYGYGFNVSPAPGEATRLSHSGAFLMGAGTSFSLLPAAATGIIALTNAQPTGAAEAVTLAYMDIVRFGRVTRDWYAFLEPKFADMAAPEGELAGLPFPQNPAAALPAHAYIGSYSNEYYGSAKVELRQGQLILAAGPGDRHFPLQHWNGNVFVFEPGGEIAALGSRFAVEFTPGPGGMAQQMRVELYDHNGQGTFSRQ